jgi:lysophospholipase L1-like esterase
MSFSFASSILQSLLSLLPSIGKPTGAMVLLSNLIIASLGSSYAAGPGIAPQLDPTAAGRSGNNYAHLATQKLTGSNLTDLSVSGATLSNILDTSQGTFAPQINGLPENADLIFVLGGGNDINYVGGLTGDSNSSVNVGDLSAKYGTVLDALHAKAANAHIIVITYLTVLGADVIPKGEDGANVVFNATRVAYHQDVAAKLRQATLDAIIGRQDWAEVLDVVDASWTHGLGSTEPWMNGSTGNPQYHPRAEGHVAVADLLYERLSSDAGKRRLRRRGAR